MTTATMEEQRTEEAVESVATPDVDELLISELIGETPEAWAILAEVQKSVKAPKDQKNGFGGYNYRNIEGINNAVKPHANVLGCALKYNYEVVAVGQRYYVRATCSLLTPHGAVSAHAWAREQDSRKGMDDAQVTGSAESYAGKYAAQALFALEGEKDPDEASAQGYPMGDRNTQPSQRQDYSQLPEQPFTAKCGVCGQVMNGMTREWAPKTACPKCKTKGNWKVA